MTPTSPLSILAIATAAPGQEKKLRAAQERLVGDTVEEPGCLRYELHQSLDNGRVLVFVETWASEKDWRAHMNGSAIRRFQSSGAGALIEDFSLHRMTLIADGELSHSSERLPGASTG